MSAPPLMFTQAWSRRKYISVIVYILFHEISLFQGAVCGFIYFLWMIIVIYLIKIYNIINKCVCRPKKIEM